MRLDDRVEQVIKKLKINKFYPFPFARTGFWQTIYGGYWPILKPKKPDAYHHIVLPDGDILVLAENRPKDWKPGGRIVLLVHGLAGDYRSTYMQRLCRRMYKKGHLVFRLNLRFCGPGKGLARRPYHGGVSEDTRQVLEWIKTRYPESPVTQMGFSLGGALSLKMAGEDGSRPSGNLDSLIAVSPPLDLKAAATRMGSQENKFFEKYFLSYLLADVRLMESTFPEVPKIKFPSDLTVRKFDEVYATYWGGFKDVDEYYSKCSALKFVPEIKVPTLILSSADDPVVDCRIVANVPHASNIDLLLTEKGGHVGFLGWGTTYDEVRWSDQAIDRWLDKTVG